MNSTANSEQKQEDTKQAPDWNLLGLWRQKYSLLGEPLFPY